MEYFVKSIKQILEEEDKVKFEYEELTPNCHKFTCNQFDTPVVLIAALEDGKLNASEKEIVLEHRRNRDIHAHFFHTVGDGAAPLSLFEDILEKIFKQLFDPSDGYLQKGRRCI